MVKFVVTGPEQTDQARGALGHLSYHFTGFTEVRNATSTGFEVVFAFPTLPGLPAPEADVPDEYFGSGLRYKDVTIDGVTLKTPYRGVIDRVLEEGADYSVDTTGMNMDAADFFRVSETRSNKDNMALVRSVFSGDDKLLGGTVKDKLNGFNGNDFVNGRGGNDVLYGGRGNDVLKGGNGRDRLDGGAGRDRLEGGKGADVFVFADSGRDRILDFRNNVDKVVLDSEALGFSDTLSGAQVVRQFGAVVGGEKALDFGGGNVLIFDGLGRIGSLSDDLQIV